uniref:Uncharacterized protein n=1 Tax=Cyprinus carpio TaxID=7962 RepID=A0A8C2K0H9_CYPCA
ARTFVYVNFSRQETNEVIFSYILFRTVKQSKENIFKLRILLEHFVMKPSCPAFFRRMCLNSIAFISRLAPTGV